MAKDKDPKFKWDIRSSDGKITEGNEWAKELTEYIGKECLKHGKGFIFAPYGGSNLTCRSFFATSHTDPLVFGSGISMMITNYIKHNPAFKSEAEIVQWVGSIMATSLEMYKEEKEDEAKRQNNA